MKGSEIDGKISFLFLLLSDFLAWYEGTVAEPPKTVFAGILPQNYFIRRISGGFLNVEVMVTPDAAAGRDYAPPLIEIKDLCYTHNKQDILHDINLEVLTGDFISIIGPNGGGKTTLLKLILGLITPSRGTLRVNGLDPRKHKTNVGYVPQYVNNNLSFPATPVDVVLMGLDLPRSRFALINRKEHVRAAHEVLDKLGVLNLADRKIVSLSGGERQRVLIARALVAKPSLLVLDEPTASIDTRGQTEFYELLQKLNKELTILMVSHDLMVVASYARSIICLNRRMHYHQSFTTSGELLDAFYSCSVEETCPVGLVARRSTIGSEQAVSHD